MSYYHFDQLGSTRLLTNSAGAVTDEYSYDAYGAVLSHNRSTGSVDQPYQYVGQLGYYTHYQQPGFGLVQLGVRFYGSEVGRFTQRDPVESDVSDYWYATGLPISAVDPSGMYSLLTCLNYASCHKCTGEQAAKGWRDIENWLKRINPKQKLIGGPNDQVDNEANAVGHCVKACRSVRYCQNDCQQVGGPLALLQARECYAFWPWRQACLMDKYNNQQGADCAARGQSCVGCCMDLFNKGKLRWLKPKRNWPQ